MINNYHYGIYFPYRMGTRRSTPHLPSAQCACVRQRFLPSTCSCYIEILTFLRLRPVWSLGSLPLDPGSVSR